MIAKSASSYRQIRLFLTGIAVFAACFSLSVLMFGFKTAEIVEPDSIGNHLIAAEMNWIRANERKEIAIKDTDFPRGQDNGGLSRVIWDLFYPSFDCPFTKERIGRVGDGGKWICGFHELISKPECIIFSFGISSDTSFEQEILRRTQNCILHMFDHTITEIPKILEEYPGRAFFHPWGIGSENDQNIVTLKNAMKKLKVKSLDVLKMDVEGAEWDAVSRMLTDFPEGLPFAQFQIEVHLNFDQENWLVTFNTWWQKLEAAGLRHFFQEPNLLNDQRFNYRELAFLNIKMKPFAIVYQP